MNDIPQVGLGLWKVTNPEEFKNTFTAALESGYRHFDTAQVYGNEALLGEAWIQANIPREELFLTTKIHVANFGYDRAMKSFETSLKNLQTSYVDLLLLHFPVSLVRNKTWKALVDIQNSGHAKHIGVSNYTVKHLEEMKAKGLPAPYANQVELHVFLQQPELVEYCRQNDILIEAYSPLAHGKNMDDPTVSKIAVKHNVSYAQVMLRWCIEQGFIILPKSAHPERVKQNMQVLDFSLDGEDMEELKKLDKNMRTCWNPTFVP
jgi:diketogulonate reductase-like aldo/keto reductase